MSNPSFEQIKDKRKCVQLRSFYYKVKDYNPEVVICVEPITLIVGIKLKRKLNCRLVYDCHEFFAMAFSERFKNPIIRNLAYRFYYTLENFLLRYTDASITVNEYLGARLAEAGDNVHICANNPVAGIKERKTGIVKKKYDFIYAGGISYDRGLKLILEACRKLKKQNIDFKFLFMGKFINEDVKKYFHEFLEENGLTKNLLYFGIIPHERVFHYLEQSKFGVMMTNPDIRRYRLTLSLKVLEYMEAGIPVLVNEYPIMKRRIIKTGTGISSEYSADAFADVMLRCMGIADKESEYKVLCEKAAELYKKKYTWESQIEELHEAVKLRDRKKMLLFAYFFPPLGGPGVQRPCKMVKYLKRSNIDTDVVSVRNIQFHSYDENMTKECRAESVIRTFTADPMGILYILKKFSKQKTDEIYFKTSETKKKLIRAIFPVDEKILWLPFALVSAFKAVLAKKYDYVMATIGPYTSGVAAYIVSIISGKPLVIDYRDHWTLNRYLFYATKLHQRISENFEQKILSRAKIVTTVSETMKEELIGKFGEHLRKKMLVMYNGWDDEDFSELKEKEEGKLVFSYVGNFYGNRSPEFLVNVLKELKTENMLPDNVLFRFVGNYHIEWQKMLDCPELEGFVDIVPQVTHEKAVDIMQNSDVLLLFIATASGKNVLTGKIFEYLRTGNEIFAMVPEKGDAEILLKSENYDHICPMEDVQSIRNHLIMLFKNNSRAVKTRKVNSEYSRENQVKKLVEHLRDGG